MIFIFSRCSLILPLILLIAKCNISLRVSLSFSFAAPKAEDRLPLTATTRSGTLKTEENIFTFLFFLSRYWNCRMKKKVWNVSLQQRRQSFPGSHIYTADSIHTPSKQKQILFSAEISCETKGLRLSSSAIQLVFIFESQRQYNGRLQNVKTVTFFVWDKLETSRGLHRSRAFLSEAFVMRRR